MAGRTIGPDRSFDILHLFAHLIDDDLQGKPGVRRLGVARLGGQRVGFAVEFLCEEIELTADASGRGEERACCFQMCLQAFSTLPRRRLWWRSAPLPDAGAADPVIARPP